MSAVNPYLKAIFGAAMAGLGAYITAVSDGSVTAAEWAAILLAAVGSAAVVWGVPNGSAASGGS